MLTDDVEEDCFSREMPLIDDRNLGTIFAIEDD